MGWFDWLDDTGGGGSTTWETDLDAAVSQAKKWIGQVAAAKGWSPSDTADALDLVDEAEDLALSSWSDTAAEAFWSSLVDMWSETSGAPGWDGLGDTFASAAGAAYDPLERVIDNVEQTVNDIAQDAKDIVNPTKSIWPWVAAGVVGFFAWRALR